VESLFQQYEAARRSLPESGRSMDSVRSNLELLARFARRLGPPERADALGQLAARWSPRAEGDEGGGGGAATEASRAAPSAASATGAGKTPRKPSAKTAAKAATRPWPKSSARGLEGAAALTAGQVSAHFSLQELTASDTARARGIANQPGPAELRRMKALCEQVLEPLRTALGKPITINSCYRGPELNAAVGGAANSQHVSGQAADIKVGGMTVMALFKHILEQGLPFDQLIYEAPSPTSQWVHVSYNADGNRSQILNAVFKPGQRTSYLGLTREQALALKPTAASRSARRAQASEPAAEPGYEERGDEPDELPAEKPRRSRSPRRARTGGTQGEG
jgi:zinc D-Ala-D-Ala carboxypeptidase